MIIALQTLIYYRQSLLAAIERALQPYYKRLSLAFSGYAEDSEEEYSDDQVFSEFDDEKGVIFFPPVYAQRYAAVSDCLIDERWRGKLEKVVDFGYHDLSFIKYLKEVPGIQQILGVDIESLPLKCSSDVFDNYNPRRESPLQVTLFQGNAADPDYRLIGCDAVIAIEMIEHMLPHDLDRLIHTVFGFIKPWIAVFTTPNGDFNVLFKALEKNGLRRWDHFFEWSREQFNDWCSNIVMRYPIYTVTCKGVGPGPPGTLHYGCCSQLALFINKDYHKQQDLNLNSLALVPRHNPKPLNDLYDCWDNSRDSLQDMEQMEPPTDMASLTDFLCADNRSQVTFVVSPNPSTSLPIFTSCSEEKIISNSDKISQCNLDTEIAKNFIMFDEEQCFVVKLPRRRINNRVYEIEDVASRLNCSTFQVKKFTKTTQNLMAKNKNDCLVHTRAVVDEIRNLTKALNFNKGVMNRPDGTNTWCNFNWGENAPYWNEYYKVVREFNCPFETKSEECRILDLVSDEINRIIDTQFEDDFSCDASRVEIPLNHLMAVVQHITDDVDQVRDILEWNGYEIVDGVVIHSRLVVGPTSVTTQNDEWQDNDSLSDWDNVTDVQSTTLSEGSMFAPDNHEDHRLRRALDQKVRNLRLMLTVDEDITTELDKVVCKLMKLALRMSRGRETPLPAKWMQCKLLDLLTLTEKTIERRKKYYIEDSLKAIEFNLHQITTTQGKVNYNSRQAIVRIDISLEFYYFCIDIVCLYSLMIYYEYDKHEKKRDLIDDKLQRIANMKRTKNDHLTNEIVAKYDHIIMPIPDLEYAESVIVPKTSSVIAIVSTKPEITKHILPDTNKAFSDVELAVEKLGYEDNGSEDNDSEVIGTVSSVRHKQKQLKHRDTTNKAIRSSSSTSFHKYKSKLEEKRGNHSSIIVKKLAHKRSGSYSFVKNPAIKYKTYCKSYNLRPRQRSRENRCFTIRASKPIPESLIDLCHPELKFGRGVKEFKPTSIIGETDDTVILNKSPGNLSREKSLIINIIMDDNKKSIASCKESINTDREEILINSDLNNNDQDQVEYFSNDIDLALLTKHDVSTENLNLQTIFLNDINEPSTSKGIRHNVRMDVQCGSNTLVTYPMSVSTSLMRISPELSNAIKNHNNNSKTRAHSSEFGTSTEDCDSIIIARSRSVGIKIKDSDLTIRLTNIDIATTMQNVSHETSSSIHSLCKWQPDSDTNTLTKQVSCVNKTDNSNISTEFVKPISSILEVEDLTNLDKIFNMSKSSTKFSKSSNILNDIHLRNLTECKDSESMANTLEVKYNKPNLSCGGVYVHSYKEKQECEDIVYQGEWQRFRPKSARKKQHNCIVVKKVNASVYRTQKDFLKERCLDSKNEYVMKNSEQTNHNLGVKKLLQMHKSKQDDVMRLQSVVSKTAKRNAAKRSRSNNNVTKVASKIGMSSITSKNTKSAFTTKKPQMMSPIFINKNNDAQKKRISLHKKKQSAELSDKYNVDINIDSKVHREIKKEELIKKQVPLKTYGTDEVRKDILNFAGNFNENVYLVLCNDKQRNSENATSNRLSASSTSTKGKVKYNNTLLSSFSLNSSTCSSTNSIVTVRTVTAKSKNLSQKKHSTSLHKSSFDTSESDNFTPTKEKRCVKKCKSIKKSDVKKATNNKENTAENFTCKDIEKLTKHLYLGQRKSVFIAQVNKNPSTIQTMAGTLLKPKIFNKSTIKILPENIVGRKQSSKACISGKKSSKSKIINDNIVSKQECVNTALGGKPHELISIPQKRESVIHTEKTLENSHLDWMRDSYFDIDSGNTMGFINKMIEELVDFIDCKYATTKDSKTIINSEHSSLDINESSSSFKTVNADYFYNTTVDSDVANSFNGSFEEVSENESFSNVSDTRLNLLSVTPASNRSEYFLADSELNIAVSLSEQTQTSATTLNQTSVTDIFERKGQRLVQVPRGFLSIQAFSGLSLDSEYVTGDQPDPISLIDSETGSLALGVTRLITSEELLISSRSSDSYESCLLDEDAVVPDWLFQIISQQQSISEHQPLDGPQRSLIDEPIYDDNGNVIEPGVINVAAGAGDGRGIHSEPSQDSSGRGTLISSSDTTSSSLSEALSTEFELQRDVTSSVVTTTTMSGMDLVDESTRIIHDVNLVAVSGHNVRARPFIDLSNIDADIGSIDTDVPDSTDN